LVKDDVRFRVGVCMYIGELEYMRVAEAEPQR
jgi:hypothetical protein